MVQDSEYYLTFEGEDLAVTEKETPVLFLGGVELEHDFYEVFEFRGYSVMICRNCYIFKFVALEVE